MMKNLIVVLFVGLMSLGSFAQEKVAKIEFKNNHAVTTLFTFSITDFHSQCMSKKV